MNEHDLHSSDPRSVIQQSSPNHEEDLEVGSIRNNFVSSSVRSQIHSQYSSTTSTKRDNERRESMASNGRRNRTPVTSSKERMVRGNSSRRSNVDAFTVPAALEPSMCVMSVVEEGSNIALCCYNEQRNEIMLEHCKASGYETESLVERFIQMARPNLVLVGNRIVNNAPFLQLVTKSPLPLPGEDRLVGRQGNSASRFETTDEDGPEMRPSSTTIPYRLLKSGTFDLRSCKAVILQRLRVRALLKQQMQEEIANERGHFDPDRHFPQTANGTGIQMYKPSSFHYLAAVIDFDSAVLVKAIGALLSYLQTTIFQLEGGILIDRIVEAKTSSYMRISSTTLSALHIFAEETHPLIAKGQENSKEGFSLYSLLDRTKSKGGRQMLREWMLKPLSKLEEITTRQDTIELFSKPILQSTVGVLWSLMQKVGPIDKILLRMQKCTTKPQDFLILNKTLSAIISIGNVLQSDILSILEAQPALSSELSFKFLSKIHFDFNIDILIDLRTRINAIVDEDATLQTDKSARSIVIRYGFHEQLDAMKEQYESLEEILADVMETLCHKHPQLDGLSILFFPQVGYLVAMSQELTEHAQINFPRDFESIFVEDGEVYFKCDEMRELDEELGDLDGAIRDTERMILTELEENILDTESELRECFNAVSIVDCILSLTDCAADMNFTRPVLIDDCKESDEQGQTQRRQLVYVKNGRHPLQEIIAETQFIPNDVRMDDHDRIMVVTGPNYSGKSCYLRQVGLIVYMAHLGSFVPCSQATISLHDQIFARISTIESCSRPQSSYQLELTEMSSILLKATSKSLVLMDEVGKGTHPASGIAILGAALKKLSSIGCNTVCTTHFLELFSMNVLKDQEAGIRARRMSMHLPSDSEGEAVPLFKLQDGVASSSAGISCAKSAGISQSIICRAKEIIQAMREKEPIRPLSEAADDAPRFTEEEKSLLLHFISVEDWENASDDDLRLLIQKVAKASGREQS